jgi:hypothetical protein
MGMTNWNVVEVGKLSDAERLQEATRERLAHQASEGQGHTHLSTLLQHAVVMFGLRVIAWGTHLHDVARTSPNNIARESQGEPEA